MVTICLHFITFWQEFQAAWLKKSLPALPTCDRISATLDQAWNARKDKFLTTRRNRREVNLGFVWRGLLLALPAAVLLAVVGFILLSFVGPFPDPTPPPPTILAPRGAPPPGLVSLQAWAQYRGQSYGPVGSGFLLRLDDGRVLGVVTAHSLTIGNPDRPLQRVALGVAGRAGFVAEFDTLHGRPGQARQGEDMTMDYVLLQPHQPVDVELALLPDSRGAPQPGERVWLLDSRQGDTAAQRALEGTVQSAEDSAVWVLMDGWFYPAMLSGSPLVSQHTGQVVGMLIAGAVRGHRLLLGVHPIGSIVRLAESADEFPRLGE